MTERTTSAATSSGQPAWLRGVTRGLPIVMGYIPIGFAYGVLAAQAGLAALHTLLMSIMVYAGSSQLIAVSLFAAGTPALSIILTTFVVNLRHLLFSAALSPHLRGWRKSELAAFAYQLTDESFAVHSARFARFAPTPPPKAEMFAVNVTAQLSWVLGSGLGVIAGQRIPAVEPWALDYTLPAMFIALLVMQIRDRAHVAVALLAGTLAVALTLAGLDQWSVILATVLAATAGVALEGQRGQVKKSANQ
jgi:4-azaleucine resistance transporter AzlC